MSNTALKLRHTSVFTKNYNAFLDKDVRFLVNQGGSRSSKTYSICQLLLWYCLTNKNKVVSVVRRGGPALFASVYRDFLGILQDLDLYNYIKHNKSNGSFTFPNGCMVQFFSIDDQQKLRGRKHNVIFINEANEITKEEFMQINMRTTEKIIMDFNPSDPFSWVIEQAQDPKAILIHSTYKDNPFLEPEIVREIENLINTDQTYYEIYALGILANGKENVFNTFHMTEFPEDIDYVYGVDFGYVDPMTVMKVGVKDGKLYIQQLLYESYLTPDMIPEKLREIGIRNDIPLICDSARPDLIQAINNAGFYAIKAKKNIKEGLSAMRQHELHIDPKSEMTYSEFRNYRYKKVKDRIMEDPVDFANHTIDAVRYAVMHLKNSFSINVMI